MNFLFISVGLMGLFGGTLGAIDGPDFIHQNFSALVTIISIMAAGLLVRLNRGVPSVDWKSVDAVAVSRLLEQIERVVSGYSLTLLLLFITLLTAFSVPISIEYAGLYSNVLSRVLAVTFGGFIGLSVGRMAYTVWLDVDIVRLQAAVILSAADSSFADTQREIAAGKANRMRGARVTQL